MGSKVLRMTKIKPGTIVSVIGDDGPPPWYGDYYVRGVLSAYMVLEQYLTPWTRQEAERTWDVGALVKLSVPLKIPENLIEGDLVHKCTENNDYVIDVMLLIQRYPDLAWADDCIVFSFGVPKESALVGNDKLYSEWKEQVIPLTTHSILKVGECK